MFETLVIDDVLDRVHARDLHTMIMRDATWKFLNDVSGAENQSFPSHGFAHLMKHPEADNVSNLYEPITSLFTDVFKSFDLSDIYHTRIFLQLPLAEPYMKEHNGVHVDLPATMPHVAAVYYVNGSDGETIIYEQTSDVVAGKTYIKLDEHARVKPKRGRMVLFDGLRYHCSSQPKINYRCIINFDLLKGDNASS